jgi:hypothetical protein
MITDLFAVGYGVFPLPGEVPVNLFVNGSFVNVELRVIQLIKRPVPVIQYISEVNTETGIHFEALEYFSFPENTSDNFIHTGFRGLDFEQGDGIDYFTTD